MSLQLLISASRVFAPVIYCVVCVFARHGPAPDSDSSLVLQPRLEKERRDNPLDRDQEQQAGRSRRVSRLRAGVKCVPCAGRGRLRATDQFPSPPSPLAERTQ